MDWNPDDWRDCEFRKYRKAQRTFGDNIPGYAQGAVFPGDEAGHYCSETGERCDSRPQAGECPRVEDDNALS